MIRVEGLSKSFVLHGRGVRLPVLAVRRTTLGHVSQFLRAIPRVPALDVVAEPLVRLGTPTAAARDRAAALLHRLNIPEPLWRLPPATFSGGEQQRVNIARGFAAERPILLLDEPRASRDPANRQVVVGLIREARDRCCAIVAIFHDAELRAAVDLDGTWTATICCRAWSSCTPTTPSGFRATAGRGVAASSRRCCTISAICCMTRRRTSPGKASTCGSAFEALPFAAAATALRRWDDHAKVPGLTTQPLLSYRNVVALCLK